MGFWDTMTGRTKPVAPKLDGLFALPPAVITLETAADFKMTGRGAICFRAAEGPAFAQTLTDVVALLDDDDDPDVEVVTDQFGFTWLLARQEDMGALVTDLHAVTTSLEVQGFGHAVLCSLVSFADPVGTVPGAGLPIQAGHVLPVRPHRTAASGTTSWSSRSVTCSADLPIEQDLSRWMALWGAPGL